MTLFDLIQFARDNGLDMETEIAVGDHAREDHELDKDCLTVVERGIVHGTAISLDLRGTPITEG